MSGCRWPPDRVRPVSPVGYTLPCTLVPSNRASIHHSLQCSWCADPTCRQSLCSLSDHPDIYVDIKPQVLKFHIRYLFSNNPIRKGSVSLDTLQMTSARRVQTSIPCPPFRAGRIVAELFVTVNPHNTMLSFFSPQIADFGTSRWSQHTNSTGLATYTTKSSQTTQMSIAWSAPEVRSFAHLCSDWVPPSCVCRA